MASELRKFNMAESSDDAVKQAQSYFLEGERPRAVQSAPIISHSSLEERRTELLLEIQDKKYQQELSLLRSAINHLASELTQIKIELKRTTEQSKILEQSKQKERQEILQTQVKEDHPRQGKFTSADVDIQKLFYFGNK